MIANEVDVSTTFDWTAFSHLKIVSGYNVFDNTQSIPV